MCDRDGDPEQCRTDDEHPHEQRTGERRKLTDVYSSRKRYRRMNRPIRILCRKLRRDDRTSLLDDRDLREDRERTDERDDLREIERRQCIGERLSE